MCSFGYFRKITDIQNIDLISSKNAQKFYIEKNTIRDRLGFELKHVGGNVNKILFIVYKAKQKQKKYEHFRFSNNKRPESV